MHIITLTVNIRFESMKLTLITATLILLTYSTHVFSCSESWVIPIAMDELFIDDEDFIETEQFLNLRYGKKNWKYDHDKYLSINVEEVSENQAAPIEINIMQQPANNEQLEVTVVLERYMSYEGEKYSEFKKYNKSKYFSGYKLIIRDDIFKTRINIHSMKMLEIRATMRSKARAVVIFTYINNDPKVPPKRIVKISNYFIYIQSHCGGSYLVDKF